MLLRRKRECSAELCTCGCTVSPFDYSPKASPAPAPQEAAPATLRWLPSAKAAPRAVGRILAPFVPPGREGSDTGGASGGGSDSGGTNGGSTGGGGGGGGGIVCFPEMCQPTWGGVDWFDRYGLQRWRKECCEH